MTDITPTTLFLNIPNADVVEELFSIINAIEGRMDTGAKLEDACEWAREELDAVLKGIRVYTTPENYDE